MSTKTVTLDADAYEILKRQKLPRESFSQVVRRLVQEECPALTARELLEALKPFEGVGAGKKRRRRAAA
jgi:predicted CopG family antitoxin